MQAASHPHYTCHMRFTLPTPHTCLPAHRWRCSRPYSCDASQRVHTSPHTHTHTFSCTQVLQQAIPRALDDPKRSVRRAAIACRRAWSIK